MLLIGEAIERLLSRSVLRVVAGGRSTSSRRRGRAWRPVVIGHSDRWARAWVPTAGPGPRPREPGAFAVSSSRRDLPMTFGVAQSDLLGAERRWRMHGRSCSA